MSLRWHLVGLHLTELWRKLSSGDESLLKTLNDELDERVDGAIKQGWFKKPSEAKAYRSSVRQVLERAVRQGAPFPELADENAAHVDSADALARAGQTLHETDSWDWKHGAWYELHERLGPTLAAPEKQLLDWLVLGRPIFGKSFGTGWEFYTYFSGAEATALRVTLAGAIARGACPGPVGDRHFSRELVGWLDDITGRGLDVWVRAE